MDNLNNQLKITTLRNAAGICNESEMREEIINIRNRSECIIDWLINAKTKVKSLPINMRKIAAYVSTLKRFIPLVLRKRIMYEELVGEM